MKFTRPISTSLLLCVMALFIVSCKTVSSAPEQGVLSLNTIDPHRNTIVFLGDSLTYGDGCQNPAEQSYPALVRHFLAKKGYNYQVINAGINGDTTSGILARMEPYLTNQTALIGLGIGVNDYHGEDSVDQIRERLKIIIKRILDQNIHLVLFKMEITFMGTNVPRFTAMYDDLAKEFGIPVFTYMPASRLHDEPGLFADIVHPNQNGHRDVAGRLLAYLNPALNTPDSPIISSF